MYHIIKSLTAVFIMTAVLCGCSRGESANITIDTAQYETEKASVYAECPTFSFMKNNTLENRINSQYREEIDSKLIEFDTASDSPGELVGGNRCIFELHQDVKYNKNDFISILSDTYIYLGGAHGNTVWSAKNIDTVMGCEIVLDDLFSDGDYKETLNRLISEEIEENADDYSDLWEIPVIKDSNQTDFFINNEGLVIFYQPYDLSYYARGMVEFTLEWEDLRGYLNENHKRLIIED